MKNFVLKSFKYLMATLAIMILGSVGIDAVDHYDNLSESIVGRLIFGKTKELCPVGMEFVEADWGDYCIDKYEVSTNGDCPHKEPQNVNESKENLDFYDCKPISQAGATPWTYISQNQAVRACMKVGKRLPSDREWSKAAIGTPDLNSNWGQNDCQVSSNWDKQPGLTGSGKNCFSYVGAFDMIGNVWEWVDGAVVDGKYQGRELPMAGYIDGINEDDGLPSGTDSLEHSEYYDDYFWIKTKNTRAISRGGYWKNEARAGQYSHYVVSKPTYAGEAVGFRCVKKVNTNTK